MKKIVFLTTMLIAAIGAAFGAQRRPVDSRHPMWLVHVDVWNKADPQKIIDLIPDDIRPYVVVNLSLSCQYDKVRKVYKMPQNAVLTYKSWATVCQLNGMWFTCQPASGGHTHIRDDDMATFEYFFKEYPNFLGWNYAEQFWGFDEPGDESSGTAEGRIALFARLVRLSHRYGGFLTVSFCGNIWSHPLNPVGMMKRDPAFLKACRTCPDSVLWLYKYTTTSCFLNNESVTFGPFVSGLASNYGIRYDSCGWNGAMAALLGEDRARRYPAAAGIGTALEQTCINGGAVWDGPELIWTEDFQNLADTFVDGYTRRNWGLYPGFRNVWIDIFRKVVDGSFYIPTRAEVVERTKVVVVNDISSGSDEDRYAAGGGLYDGLYLQKDPMNAGTGRWMDNHCYFKRTGRYATIPVTVALADDVARGIPVQVAKSECDGRWPSVEAKRSEFDRLYPEVAKGDLFVSRLRNQLVCYMPFSGLDGKKSAAAVVPLRYNTCSKLGLQLGLLGAAVVTESANRLDVYLNNYRYEGAEAVVDRIVLKGVRAKPAVKVGKREDATVKVSGKWNAEEGEYRIAVSHHGPIDLTILASGGERRARAQPLPTTPLAADPPKRPPVYTGRVVVEAEDMDFRSVRRCVLDPYGQYPDVTGHAGNGFIDMGGSQDGSLRRVQRLNRGGTYRIEVRYAASARAGRFRITANGVAKDASVEKAGRSEWRTASVTAKLRSGENTIVVDNPDGIDSFIDQIVLSPLAGK